MVSLLVQPNSESFWAFLRMVLTPLIQLCKINYVFNWTIHRKNQFMYVSFVTFDKLSQFQDACFGNNLGGTFARSILIRSGRSVKKWQQILYSRTTCFGVSSNTTTCDVIRLETCCYASKSSDNIRTLKCNRGLKPNGGNGKECIILPLLVCMPYQDSICTLSFCFILTEDTHSAPFVSICHTPPPLSPPSADVICEQPPKAKGKVKR